MSFVLTNCISDPLSFCFKTFKSGQESSPFSSPDGSVLGAPIMPTPLLLSLLPGLTLFLVIIIIFIRLEIQFGGL